MAVGLFLLPFLGRLSVDYDRFAPLTLFPALWVGRKMWRRNKTPSAPELIDRGLLLTAAIIGIVASFGSQHPIPSLVTLASWIWIFSGALLVRQLVTNNFAVRLLLIGITTGSTLGCLLIWAGWKEGTAIGAFPYYGHARLFGLHMMVGLLAGLVWLGHNDLKKADRALATLMSTVTCGGVWWAGGRSAIIGVFVGIVAWWWCSPRDERRRLLRSLPLVVLGGLALSCINWSPEPYLGWWRAIARSQAATSIDELTSTRLSFWNVTWTEFLKKPWIGHGADAYRFLSPKQDGDQPHNWVLQLLLDFGVIGGGACGLLLVRQAIRGLTARAGADCAHAVFLQRSAAGCFTGCLAAGLFDGGFYHALVLLPTTAFAAIAGCSSYASATKPRVLTGWICLTITAAVLLTHNYLFFRLFRGQPPPSPREPVAKWVRIFPSTTMGLERWLDKWRLHDETATLEWTLWAQHHSENPTHFHLYAAIIYADRNDFVSADREMTEAIAKAHWTIRAKLEQFRSSIRKAGLQQTSGDSGAIKDLL